MNTAEYGSMFAVFRKTKVSVAEEVREGMVNEVDVTGSGLWRLDKEFPKADPEELSLAATPYLLTLLLLTESLLEHRKRQNCL